jgi:hypothetical protein
MQTKKRPDQAVAKQWLSLFSNSSAHQPSFGALTNVAFFGAMILRVGGTDVGHRRFEAAGGI